MAAFNAAAERAQAAPISSLPRLPRGHLNAAASMHTATRHHTQLVRSLPASSQPTFNTCIGHGITTTGTTMGHSTPALPESAQTAQAAALGRGAPHQSCSLP